MQLILLQYHHICFGLTRDVTGPMVKNASFMMRSVCPSGFQGNSLFTGQLTFHILHNFYNSLFTFLRLIYPFMHEVEVGSLKCSDIIQWSLNHLSASFILLEYKALIWDQILGSIIVIYGSFMQKFAPFETFVKIT